MHMKILFTCLSLTVLFVLSGARLYAQNNAMNIPSGSWVDCGSNSALNATNIKTMECWIKFGNLTDMSGRLMLSRSVQLSGSANSLETGSLPAGSYLLRVVPAAGGPVMMQFQVVR